MTPFNYALTNSMLFYRYLNIDELTTSLEKTFVVAFCYLFTYDYDLLFEDLRGRVAFHQFS